MPASAAAGVLAAAWAAVPVKARLKPMARAVKAFERISHLDLTEKETV
jgi:hypothetical protein